MKVRMLDDIYSSNENIKRYLKPGNVVKVFISEHNKGDKPEHGWYLIDCGHESTGIYVSDPEVERGDIVREFQDPELPAKYNKGPYQWINKEQAEIFVDTNSGAKHLLKKYDWSL